MGLLLPDDSEADLRDLLRWWRSPAGQRVRNFDVSEAFEGLLVKNTENATIPAWACLEVTGTANENDAPNFLTVKKPTSNGTLFVFNGPESIEPNGYGCAQSGPIYRVYKSTGTVTLGNRWAPTAGQYYLTKGYGAYVVVGSDDIGTDVFRVVRDDIARMYRFTINESLADGTASSDILEMDGTDTGVDAVVNDPLGIFATLTTTNDPGYCLHQDGKFYAVAAPLDGFDVRVKPDGTALQKSFDGGSTWTDWATIGSCS